MGVTSGDVMEVGVGVGVRVCWRENGRGGCGWCYVGEDLV